MVSSNCGFGVGYEMANRKEIMIKNPNPVIQYNKYKGVNLANQYASYYSNDHKSYNW